MANQPLSEHEVDALVTALAMEEDGPSGVARRVSELDRTIRAYDFRRPEKLAREHLRALLAIHEGFARGLGTALTSYVRAHTQARLVATEQLPYREYLAGLPEQVVIYPLTLEPLPGRGVMALDLALTRVILDRLLGGSGVVRARSRELTDIELALLRTFGGFVAERLREAWAGVLALGATVQEPVLSPDLAQVTSGSEVVAAMTIELAVLKGVGALSVCLPYPLLKPVLEQLRAQVQLDEAARPGTGAVAETPLASDGLGQVALPMVVELGRATISLRDLLGMTEGQVIKLDTAADGDLPVRIGGSVKFSGRPGLIGKSLGVHVTARHG